MCKELTLVNRVDLGTRVVGFELYNPESQDIAGKTEKQIKDCIKSGTIVKGFKLNDSNELVIDDKFIRNLMVKTGVGTLTPSKEDSIVNLMYTVIGKSGKEYEVITSRFYHGMITEEKLKALHELGAVNGISLDKDGNIQLVEVKSITVKEDKKNSKVAE